MKFVIQVCNPTVRQAERESVGDVAAAIQAIYPSDTEDAILVWNRIPIRINYKYDLSVLFDDLIAVLLNVRGSDIGQYRVYWGSDTFRAQWILTWESDRVSIRATWDSTNGSYEDLLNSRNEVTIGRAEFLAEWKALLGKIISSIQKAGIEIADQAGLRSLREIEAAIPSYGVLYSTRT